jgi:hypothetical protein
LVKKPGFLENNNEGTPSLLPLSVELASELNKKRFPFSSRGAIAEDGAEKCESEEEPFWPLTHYSVTTPPRSKWHPLNSSLKEHEDGGCSHARQATLAHLLCQAEKVHK